MAASTADKLTATYNAANPNVARVTSTRTAGAATLACDNLAGWPTVSKVHFATYRINTSGAVVAGTQIDWYGIVSGNNITSMTRITGATDAGHSIGDVVEAMPTASWAQGLYDWGTTHANMDGTLKTTAVQTALGISSNPTSDWNLLNAGVAPTTVTYNGNRSYDIVFATNDLTSVVSPGMRLRTTRTVTAPTQCTSLNGTTQYYSKSSPAGMTSTDDIAGGAWIRLTNYPSALGTIESRYNGTSGFSVQVTSTGQIRFIAYNAGGANFSYALSYQSVPLNKWVHVAAQLDMSSFTASPTTSYVMIDGSDVPISVSRGGTNPTAFIQAGNLEIGSENGGANPFPGKISQAFVTSAKVTQANIRTLISQGITSALITTNNIVSAYSFDNSITDLNATSANNLTANGSAVATNADSFSGQQASGSISSTLDYCEVISGTYSTNTTFTVRVPEGCTIPTSGGVTNVYFSSAGKPYGWPGISDQLGYIEIMSGFQTASTSATAIPGMSYTLTVPTGGQRLKIKLWAMDAYQDTGGGTGVFATLWDGTVGSGTQLSRTLGTATANLSIPVVTEITRTFAAGTHTFNAGFKTGAGTGYIESNVTYPAFLSIERLQ